MKHLLLWFTKKALNGIIPGAFFVLTVASVTYALTYNWSDPSGIRNRSAGNPLTASGWNLLVGNVDNLNERVTNVEWGAWTPAGAVMAFNLTDCPTGWSIADGNGGRPDLRGEFIRGWDGTGATARGVDNGRTLRSFQEATGFSDIGSSGTFSTAINTDGNISASTTYYQNQLGPIAGNYKRVRPRNIALLYCVKN